MEYYAARYKEEIKELEQPMLLTLNSITGEESYLVPELCRMTGLTEELLDDNRAMRDIRQVTHSDAPVKVKDCIKLFQTFAEKREC